MSGNHGIRTSRVAGCIALSNADSNPVTSPERKCSAPDDQGWFEWRWGFPKAGDPNIVP